MNEDTKLEYFAWANNRSTGQTKFLYELCDNDFDKLLHLMASLKRFGYIVCPGDKETVSRLLSLDFEKKYDEKYLSDIL